MLFRLNWAHLPVVWVGRLWLRLLSARASAFGPVCFGPVCCPVGLCWWRCALPHVLHACWPVCLAFGGSICWSLSCSGSPFCGSVRASVSHLQVPFATGCDLHFAFARGPNLPFLLVEQITCRITLASVAPSARRPGWRLQSARCFWFGPASVPAVWWPGRRIFEPSSFGAAVVLSARRLWLHLLFL